MSAMVSFPSPSKSPVSAAEAGRQAVTTRNTEGRVTEIRMDTPSLSRLAYPRRTRPGRISCWLQQKPPQDHETGGPMSCCRRFELMFTVTMFTGGPLLNAAEGLPNNGAEKKEDPALLNVGDFLDWEQVGSPQISPDGTQIIYTRQWVNKQADRWDSALWIMKSDGSRNRFLADGSDAVWSRDGSRIAYLAEGKPKGTQVFVRWMDAEGASSQVTRVEETPANLKWSPVGTSI